MSDNRIKFALQKKGVGIYLAQWESAAVEDILTVGHEPTKDFILHFILMTANGTTAVISTKSINESIKLD